MITKNIVLGTVLLAFGIGVYAAPLQVMSIESRESGYHALYLSGPIQDENCTLTDRAIVLESSDGGKSMLSVSLTALATGKKVLLGVSGCSIIAPDQTQHTAPKVVKVHIYN